MKKFLEEARPEIKFEVHHPFISQIMKRVKDRKKVCKSAHFVLPTFYNFGINSSILHGKSWNEDDQKFLDEIKVETI